MRATRVFLLVLIALLAIDCAGKKKKFQSPSGGKINVPEWYADPPDRDEYLVGVATATSLDLQTAVDKARHDGRVEIARQLDLKVTGMSKRFVEETGLYEDAELLDMFTQASKTVISESFSGSRMSKQKLDQEGSVYRAYVLMELPIGEANVRLLEKINSQKRLYTRFRATQAYEELDQMVEQYEQWKREQMQDMQGR